MMTRALERVRSATTTTDKEPELEAAKKKIELDQEAKEFYNNKEYKTVEEALEIFKNDDLVSKPGEKFIYTTHGYTLLSAVLEKIAEEPFVEQANKLFKLLGMNHTRLDKNQDIISCRTRYYYRDQRGKLRNSPEVNNSCKWAGGGFVSTIGDLLIFADSMLHSFHSLRYPGSKGNKKPLIDEKTLDIFWKGEITLPSEKHQYALGWYKSGKLDAFGPVSSKMQQCGYWMHTGGAVGASSIILIKPDLDSTTPNGVCIAIMTNLEECSELLYLALELADIFQNCK